MIETRNFCIIAHIDHGKSTLADRFIEHLHTEPIRLIHKQILDSMEIEQERGITIKSQAISLPYCLHNKQYELNLIDTPGHVDFSYEVKRSITASEGAILLIDATQGVQAQTISNYYLALEQDLTIIPVINKIDLPSADTLRVTQQIVDILGFSKDEVVLISAKLGDGMEQLFCAIIERIPAPTQGKEQAFRGFIVDSHYDSYRGVILHVRIYSGEIKQTDKIQFYMNNAIYQVEEIGKFRLGLKKTKVLCAGNFGYIIAGIKNISDVEVGDTIFHQHIPMEPVKSFEKTKPHVFSSIFPSDSNRYSELVVALEKLSLNDASFTYKKDSSIALGSGFRCGFLGVLHLEIIQERLEREFNLPVIFTAPSVRYQIRLKNSDEIFVDFPQDFPDSGHILECGEPYIQANIILPDEYLGAVLALCDKKRGKQQSLQYISAQRVELVYQFPFAEILFDFYGALKSITRGYASFDYDMIGYQKSDIVKLEILLNGKVVDALSMLVWRASAQVRARALCVSLKELIPRHQFRIPIQGAVAGKIIARETVPAYRKDVTAKCYGGDITRKRKLLGKQKKGKQRLRKIGNIELPQAAFLAVLRSPNE